MRRWYLCFRGRKETTDTSDFTPELIERAKQCKTDEELLAHAREEGLELSEEELEGISGGWGGSDWCHDTICNGNDCDLECDTYWNGTDTCSNLSCTNYFPNYPLS